MRLKLSYSIVAIGLSIGLCSLVATGPARAQETQQYTRTGPADVDINCSGVVTNQAVPTDTYVISGENSRYKTTFRPGDLIYINRGGESGVKAGDQFEVVRAIADPNDTVWFKYQPMLSRAMGTRYADIGRLSVVHVDAKTSTTEMSLACGMALQRGDLVRPFVARPVPQFHQTKLDPFAPPSGKKTAMVVNGKEYSQLAGPGRIIYVNLGSAQGVRIGDYFRVFRYQGTHIETNFQVRDTAYKAYGFGSAPVAYEWNNLPRQVLGEGIVLRIGPNAATVLLTDVRFEIFAGDYVELE